MMGGLESAVLVRHLKIDGKDGTPVPRTPAGNLVLLVRSRRNACAG